MSTGTTPIPNDVLEYLARYRMAGEWWRVLMYLARGTWGYSDGNGGRRKWMEATLAMVARATDMSKPEACKVLGQMGSARVVVRRELKDPEGLTVVQYGINPDYEEWAVRPKKDTRKKARATGGAAAVPEEYREAAERVFRLWQEVGSMRHKKPATYVREAALRLGDGYTEEELVQAVRNFGVIYHDRKYYYDRQLTLKQMMQPETLDQFLTVNHPHEKFLDKAHKPRKKRPAPGVYEDAAGRAMGYED